MILQTINKNGYLFDEMNGYGAFFFIDSSDCEIRICLLVLLIFIQTKNCVWRKDETLTRNLILILFHKIVNCLYFLFLFVCSFHDTLKRIIQFFSQISNLVLYLLKKNLNSSKIEVKSRLNVFFNISVISLIF